MPPSEIPVPQAGLRQPGVRLRNKSNDIVRTSLVVPAGDELEVSAYVAGQVLAQSSGIEIVASGGDAAPDAVPPAADGAAAIEEAGGGSARRRAGRRGDGQ